MTMYSMSVLVSVLMLESVLEWTSTTELNYQRIKLGMKLPDVQKVLKSKGKDYSEDFKIERSGFIPMLASYDSEGPWDSKEGDNGKGMRFGWVGEQAVIIIRVSGEMGVTDRMMIRLKWVPQKK